MRSRVNQISKVVVLLATLAVTAIAFQNCGQYQTLGDEDSSSALQTCSGSACTQSREGILIKVGNDPTILLYQLANGTKDTAFDVGGYCDTGGFTSNRINWTLAQPNGGAIIAQGPGMSAAESAKIRCDANGRFHFRVDLPTGYNYSQANVLTVTLYGIDDYSNEVGNPLTLNTDTRPVQMAINPITN